MNLQVDENGWFNLFRLGLFETADFIYGDRINVEYSKEYALEVSLTLSKIAEQFIK